MTLLYALTHPTLTATDGAVLERQAVYGIIRDGDNVLLMHTRSYDDYSLPGCGLNGNETAEEGLVRELRDEAGAMDIRIGRYLGHGDEYRPPQKPGYDVLFVRSHFYLCQVGQLLGKVTPGSQDVWYGITARWVNIHEAIRHNESSLTDKPPGMGLSIERETFILRHVLEHGLRFEG